jgi:hypothetical protein
MTVVRRHGALLAVEDEAGMTEIAARSTLTKRGARDAYSYFKRYAPSASDAAPAGSGSPCVVVSRVESGRIVQQERIPFPAGGDDPDAGVREPRRPRPFTGGAAVAADP